MGTDFLFFSVLLRVIWCIFLSLLNEPTLSNAFGGFSPELRWKEILRNVRTPPEVENGNQFKFVVKVVYILTVKCQNDSRNMLFHDCTATVITTHTALTIMRCVDKNRIREASVGEATVSFFIMFGNEIEQARTGNNGIMNFIHVTKTDPWTVKNRDKSREIALAMLTLQRSFAGFFGSGNMPVLPTYGNTDDMNSLQDCKLVIVQLNVNGLVVNSLPIALFKKHSEATGDSDLFFDRFLIYALTNVKINMEFEMGRPIICENNIFAGLSYMYLGHPISRQAFVRLTQKKEKPTVANTKLPCKRRLV